MENIEEKNVKSNKKPLVIGGIVAAVALIALAAVIVMQNKKLAEADMQVQELQLMTEQLELSNQYDELSASFQQHEGQMILFNNDSIRAEYEAAKNKVEELREELKRRDQLSRQRIAELQKEIATLRNIMRHYVEQINELSQENESLRNENQDLSNQNRQLSNQVQTQTKTNQELTQRVEQAEKLNVTAVSLQCLKGNGRTEKNVTKAKQLLVTFTIPQNNSTPVGEKRIFLRITSPEGNLLQGNGITFPFEGAQLPASAAVTVEYAGEELPGVKIYWDNNATLNPGTYKVELFADNYRLCSRDFELKK